MRPPLFKRPRSRRAAVPWKQAFGLERLRPQSRHVGGTRARRRPVEAAILLGYLDVVDAGLAAAHQAVLIEFPLLVAVGAVPLAARVVPLILKAHRDAVVVEGPQILDQAVVDLICPFAGEEGDDGGAALKELRAVA